MISKLDTAESQLYENGQIVFGNRMRTADAELMGGGQMSEIVTTPVRDGGGDAGSGQISQRPITR